MTAWAQPGSSSSSSGSSSSSSTYCDTCGADASYQETIDTSGTYAKRTVVSNGCPNHYNYCTGKDTGTCGAVGAEGTGTEALVQTYSFDIPASPIIATSVDTTPECVTDSIGIALNGVPIYSGAVSASCDILDVSDSSAEWTSFDFCGGHGRCLANDCTGDYHYHFPPSCLETQIGKLSDGHSPLLGWALDGFPIYGPFGPGGVVMAHASQGCSGTYCLDACSGLELDISGLDDFKYRYYFNGPLSDLTSLPTDPKPATTDYPFAFKCYKGCTYAQLTAGDSRCTGGTSGVTASYTASAKTGVTALFESSAATAAGRQCAGTGSSSSSSSSSTSTTTTTTGSTTTATTSPPPSPSSPASSDSGCGGGCIGGIVGGAFVPTLVLILWLGGAFGPKCPSPFKSTAKVGAV